jgi:hypothetical protein
MRDSTHLDKYRLTQGDMASTPEMGMYGAFFIPFTEHLAMQVIASAADPKVPGSDGWEHVSVVARVKKSKNEILSRTPTWAEMCRVKELFFKDEETVVQFHPKKTEYVNFHPHCLHLWRHVDDEFKLPPSYLVGPKIVTPEPPKIVKVL